MFNELSGHLKDEMFAAYWYEEALHTCEELLRAFSDNEWAEVLKAIPVESTSWRIRLVECLGELKSPYEIKCIIQALEMDDNEDLFIACVDALRFIELSTLPESHKEKVEGRIRDMKGRSSPPVKLALEDYLKKHS